MMATRNWYRADGLAVSVIQKVMQYLDRRSTSRAFEPKARNQFGQLPSSEAGLAMGLSPERPRKPVCIRGLHQLLTERVDLVAEVHIAPEELIQRFPSFQAQLVRLRIIELLSKGLACLNQSRSCSQTLKVIIQSRNCAGGHANRIGSPQTNATLTI